MSSPTRLAQAEEERQNLLASDTTYDLSTSDDPEAARNSAPDEDEGDHQLSNGETNGNGHVNGTSSSSSRWNILPKRAKHVRFPPDDEEENENGFVQLPSGKRKRRDQYIVYALLILAGMVIGAVFNKALSRRWRAPEQGPMVPPVWTLPEPTGDPRNPAYLVQAESGAVASEDVTCSNLGVSILRDKNGTAVDAAITTTLCIGLLNAFSSGIGGGGFMVVRIPEESPLLDARAKEAGIWAIDFRETSPGKSDKWMYGTKKAGRMAAQVGGLAIGVPGELRGLEKAHELYGTLPWKDVVMPVAELARHYQVSRELARRLRIFGQFMLDSKAWSKVYAPKGYLVVEGEWISRINYGRTLEKIANEGAGAFYEGDIAESTVKTIKDLGGIMNKEDLRKYKAIQYPAIHQTYHGKTVYTTSAPSSGGILLGLLNLLEPYNIGQNGCLDSTLNTHRLIEALQFAFGARSEITDPAFATNISRFDEFYSKGWADEVRPKITDDKTHDIPYYGLLHDTPADHGTTHLSVVDRWGGVASVTSTVNLIWGSHVMDPATGVIFNDEQDDFAVPGAADAFGLLPSPWNYPAPGKKPISSTAASVILNSDGSLYAVLGGSGGSRIFPSIAQVILNLECGLNLSEAIERPRVHNQVVPPLTTVEVGPEGEDTRMLDELRAKGHKIGVFDINMGVSEIQGIVIENGTIWASSDSRKNGIAAGY